MVSYWGRMCRAATVCSRITKGKGPILGLWSVCSSAIMLDMLSSSQIEHLELSTTCSLQGCWLLDFWVSGNSDRLIVSLDCRGDCWLRLGFPFPLLPSLLGGSKTVPRALCAAWLNLSQGSACWLLHSQVELEFFFWRILLIIDILTSYLLCWAPPPPLREISI